MSTSNVFNFPCCYVLNRARTYPTVWCTQFVHVKSVDSAVINLPTPHLRSLLRDEFAALSESADSDGWAPLVEVSSPRSWRLAHYLPASSTWVLTKTTSRLHRETPRRQPPVDLRHLLVSFSFRQELVWVFFYYFLLFIWYFFTNYFEDLFSRIIF